ncbi:AMP-binding protein [Streptomyces sp. NPDC006372]|uniref:class I adenylate-forming enzyme family protein n=1 Tax=Streptomyces sp. NPDC006372 TaxID=3155599 RepID=UPI0033B8A2A3
MWLSEILDRHCQQRPDAPAVVEGEKQLTWRELRRAAHAVAAHLGGLGVKHGDRVAVYSRNRVEVVVSYFALAHLGAPFVPVNHAMSAAEFHEVAERLEVKHVLGEQRPVARLGLGGHQQIVFDTEEFQALLTAEVPASPPAARLDDPYAVLLTSGTTGKPKGVVHTAGALRQMSLSWLAAVEADDRVRLLNLNSLTHGSITFTMHYLAAGATLCLMREFQPRAVLRELERREITHVWLVPQVLRFLMMAVGKDTTVQSNLREILFGASPINPDLLADAMHAFGCDFRNVYGMTEAGGTIATWLTASSPAAPGAPLESSGRGVPGIRVEIHDEHNQPVPSGEMGEVCVLAIGRMSHYASDPTETAEIIVDGWVRTGDVGHMDENGYIHLKARKKDLIKRGGQNVFPAELESVIGEIPDVHDVAVAGVPDADWGEVPVAFVVARAGAVLSPVDIQRFLADRLASYKQPKLVKLVDEIPRNPAGKILRRVLVSRHIDEAVAARTS